MYTFFLKCHQYCDSQSPSWNKKKKKEINSSSVWRADLWETLAGSGRERLGLPEHYDTILSEQKLKVFDKTASPVFLPSTFSSHNSEGHHTGEILISVMGLSQFLLQIF